MATQVPITDTTQNPKPNPVKKFFKKLLLYFFLFFLLGCVALYGFYNFTFRDGDSAGLLVSFTTEGYIFKTHEGTLNLGSVSGGSNTANNTWAFSVKDEGVASQLSALQGKMVKVHYKEKKGRFFWQGQTNKFVDKVEEVK